MFLDEKKIKNSKIEIIKIIKISKIVADLIYCNCQTSAIVTVNKSVS